VKQPIRNDLVKSCATLILSDNSISVITTEFRGGGWGFQGVQWVQVAGFNYCSSLQVCCWTKQCKPSSLSRL